VVDFDDLNMEALGVSVLVLLVIIVSMLEYEAWSSVSLWVKLVFSVLSVPVTYWIVDRIV